MGSKDRAERIGTCVQAAQDKGDDKHFGSRKAKQKQANGKCGRRIWDLEWPPKGTYEEYIPTNKMVMWVEGPQGHHCVLKSWVWWPEGLRSRKGLKRWGQIIRSWVADQGRDPKLLPDNRAPFWRFLSRQLYEWESLGMTCTQAHLSSAGEAMRWEHWCQNRWRERSFSWVWEEGERVDIWGTFRTE